MPLARPRHRAALAAAAFLLAAAPLAWSQDRALPLRPDAPAISPACIIPPELAHFDRPLTRTTQRMSERQPIRIVAIGSSSTYGEGASSPDWTYPNRLRLELAYRFPGLDLTVVNRGVNGDNDNDKRARFQRDVVAERPDLVLWQLGTNSMLGGAPMETHLPILQGGVGELRKATGADIVLIDPQYAPKVLRGSGANAVIEMIAETARATDSHLFRRFELMRRWREVEQIAFDKFISPDELHMNDWSYACIARALGTAIADAATRPAAPGSPVSLPSSAR
ncbi:MAG TPA: SGNH/GDSL hydrolase family protein [Xanthobacteraceae bacterium]|nr:SGNH/GDSL hydrolase family protein [Xanthobacteraceae bacterium]